MKKLITLFALIFLTTSAFPTLTEDIQIKLIDEDRIRFYPVPKDHKNYFFLQSIADTTQILIGDFASDNKQRIILITLNDDFNTIKSVTEYDPRKKNIMVTKTSDSKYFTTDVVKLKKDIILGTIYRNNFADNMKSYNELETVFKRNEASNVLSDTYGFTIKLSEIDEKTKPMALFSFGKSETGYYLQFKTEYSRLNQRTTTTPILKYSVYCKDTKDPDIMNLVEELFKIREPLSRGADHKSKSN